MVLISSYKTAAYTIYFVYEHGMFVRYLVNNYTGRSKVSYGDWSRLTEEEDQQVNWKRAVLGYEYCITMEHTLLKFYGGMGYKVNWVYKIE